MRLALTIYGLSPTHSATPPKCSEGSDTCNYGLTTTQQQAHNRNSAGFLNKFQTQVIIKTLARLTLRLVRSWYNSWVKVLFIYTVREIYYSTPQPLY